MDVQVIAGGFADPVYELGFGYVPRQAEPGGIGCRNFQSAAVWQAIDGLGQYRPAALPGGASTMNHDPTAIHR